MCECRTCPRGRDAALVRRALDGARGWVDRLQSRSSSWTHRLALPKGTGEVAALERASFPFHPAPKGLGRYTRSESLLVSALSRDCLKILGAVIRGERVGVRHQEA